MNEKETKAMKELLKKTVNEMDYENETETVETILHIIESAGFKIVPDDTKICFSNYENKYIYTNTAKYIRSENDLISTEIVNRDFNLTETGYVRKTKKQNIKEEEIYLLLKSLLNKIIQDL